jgi:uncharacterized protein (DUF433 family)
MKTALKGVLHGKTIELDQAPDFPDGQEVTVEITPIPPKDRQTSTSPPWWLEYFEVNPAVAVGKLLVKGTQHQAEPLVALLEDGTTEMELLQQYPPLTPADLAALREYAKVPLGLRRSLGAWADESAELDDYLEWNRQRRKLGRREIEP